MTTINGATQTSSEHHASTGMRAGPSHPPDHALFSFFGYTEERW